MKREFREIPLIEIVLSGDNKRKIDEKSEGFAELKASIKAGGVRVPIQVRLHPDKKGKYELRYGERRYRACKALGLKTIPAIVTDSMTEEDALDLTYIENKFREDLKPLEEAAEVALMMERFGNNVKEVGKRIGKNAQWVYARANIAKGLIKAWRKVVEGPEYKSWTLSHLCQIARLPEHIQNSLIDAIDGIYEPEEMSASDLAEFIGKELHLLSKSKWNLEDETLLPKAGACKKCPKRCGYQPMLWFDSDDQVDAGDQCLDGFCWKAKEMAWLQRKAKELREKHPDLVFICKEYPSSQDAKDIYQAIGPYLSYWEYKSSSKSEERALPAMYIHGKAAGQLTYIKIDSAKGEKIKTKGNPTTLKERQQQLDAKRWSQVLLDLREKVKRASVADITYPNKICSIMSLVAAYGNKMLLNPFYGSWAGEDNPKTSKAEITKLVKSKDGQARALELLWQSFLPTLDNLLTYNGPIKQTPKKYQVDAAWIAGMIGVDIKQLFDAVSKCKSFTVPKSWSKLNADGTLKKEE